MENDWQSIVTKAYRLGASDIFIQPVQDSFLVQTRVHSNLYPLLSLSKQEGERFIAHFKYQSDMDIGERRKPQTGACRYEVNEKIVDLRISTIPNYQFNESMVIRLLKREQYQSSGFFPKQWNKLSELMVKKSGLILFSGPIGSGKTTSVHQLLLERVQSLAAHVITIEDPVERRNEQFLQVEVNERAGLTYDVILRQCLRHSPDILFIGEIRDEETAQMVIRASLTGHLVLATIHAKDCRGVILRMEELGVTRVLMEQCLLGVVSQRLLNCFCPLCEGDCHLYCEHRKHAERQLALYDLMTENLLQDALRDKVSTGLSSMNRLLRKVYRNGYITEECYKKFETE